MKISLLDYRRLLSFLLTALVLSFPLTAFAEYDPEKPELLTEDQITATSFILIEQESGNIIMQN